MLPIDQRIATLTKEINYAHKNYLIPSFYRTTSYIRFNDGLTRDVLEITKLIN